MLFALNAILLGLCQVVSGGDVIYAVNAGGGHHIDSSGIHYIADPLNVGVASDYGQRFQIRRVSSEDQVLYQTERWHDQSFSYDIPVKGDGDYVLVLKFAEVYFNEPDQKVFSVQLNDRLIVSDLDLYDRVGHATAHDEVIPFRIENRKLEVNGEESEFNDALTVEFLKGQADNPKVCAFYLMKGKKEEIIELHPIEKEEIDDDLEEDAPEEAATLNPKKSSQDERIKRDKLKSGPPAINPYAEDSSSLILPIIVAFCAFIPTLVCLCRL